MKNGDLKLNFGFDFYDLYDVAGLARLGAVFGDFFKKKNPILYGDFCRLRSGDGSIDEGGILLGSAKVLEEFLACFFGIENEVTALKKSHEDLQKISLVRREFVQRIVAKKYKEMPFDVDGEAILKDLGIIYDDVDDLEVALAEAILPLLDENGGEEYEKLVLYAVFALYSKEGRRFHENGALFILPQKIDYDNLVSDVEFKCKRDGFNLTDHGFSRNRVMGEANYCIFCHKQGKDSCRTGIWSGDEVKKNPLGVALEGCPLDQKISEMNLLKSQGFCLASMAVAAIDNPLMAGTGHRICNDCMKSCIFQKQDPVNIPQIESENLKDVLALPWGFEIYSLLTRWNPLKFGDELPREDSGKKILVAGLGPAGYVLSHYLLNEGHLVVAIDGLKIEPLNPEVSGVDVDGNHVDFKPIKYLDDIYESLSTRLIQGFGGVAEYGITSRWDKNFLTVIRLLLERRRNFRMFGGLRFGSSIDDKTVFDEYGFDHIALCIGAGRPNIIDIENNFSKGIRSASDFLMALQLTGAFKRDLFTNLQVRLPIVVVGAGLTAVDTACEAQEYYILQIEKFAEKFFILRDKYGEDFVWRDFNEEEKGVALEFLRHFEELGRIGKGEFIKKYHAKILYRKKIKDSPAYRLNHEELIKAFEQGVEFVEEKSPGKAILDKFGHIEALKCKEGDVFECRSLLVAAGTSANISVKIEDGLDLDLDGKYFKQIGGSGAGNLVKQGEYSFFTRIDNDKKSISFFGDLHPNFEGNVVKAMASAKIGYKKISESLGRVSVVGDFVAFMARINVDFAVRVAKIEAISPFLNEIQVRAPLLARKTEIGHIFRLQNYHVFADIKKGQRMAMEGVTVTALGVDRQNGFIKGILLDYGGSTSLVRGFKVGEPCIFMGPGGKPTDLAQNETVLLIGGGRGNMPLTEIGLELKNRGCRVIFCAGYRKNASIWRQKRMEDACDVLIYAIEDEAPNLNLRQGDFAFQGDVTVALQGYFSSIEHGVDRIFAIGSDAMMASIAKLRYDGVVDAIKDAKVAIVSLNAPMQCMMKGVCSQCLQKRVAKDGREEYFYACADQDQDMDRVDFAHLQARCGQNSTQEKMTRMWIGYLRG